MALFAEFFGGTPKVPKFNPVDVQDEQAKAIAGNQASLPALETQATEVNRFNADQLTKMLEQAMPGYSKVRDKYTANVQDWLAGKVPSDVSDAVNRNAAGRALYGGFGGSGMARNLSARDLGLTSLDIMGKGMQAADRWIQQSKSGLSQFDVSSMFVKPEFQAQFAAQERNAQFQRDYVKNQWDWYGSFGQELVRFEDTAVQLAAAAAGAMMGCWVAREVLGTDTPKWMIFRHWLFTSAPEWFRKLYLKHGEKFALWIHNKPILKSIIRVWMESRIETLEVPIVAF